MSVYDVFLSYNNADQQAVELVAHRLREQAALEPFLDRWHLVPGQPWQEAIEEALDACQTVAVFVGSSGVSPWHNEEMRAGLDRAVRGRDDVRVIPVLLPGANPDAVTAFLSRRTCVDFRSGLDDTDAFDRLVAGILGQPPEQADPFTLPDEPAPYPGLLPFTEKQAGFFFGRTDERDRLLARVRESSFVAVVGASGSGKSSLVLAGLLPALHQDWQALALVPGARPLRALADQLATLGPTEGRLRRADDLESRFTERDDGLSTASSTLLVDRPEIATLLIVVDQFEELFTQVAGIPKEVRQQQHQFIANLVDAARTSGGRLRVILTLRADFVRHCLDFADLRTLLEANQLLLGPMGEDALREAIVKPAQTVGAMFEKGLVGRLMDEMRDQPAALPLLSFALTQLWQRRRGAWLTHAAYEEIDGVSGAIDQRADAIYGRLSETQKHLARNLFVRLVTLGEGASDTRRRVRRDELRFVGTAPQEVDELVRTLSHRDVRLIAADAEAVELAHEALIEQWGRLRAWLDEDRDGLRTHRRLTEAAQEWDDLNCDPSALYRGTQLAQTQEWATTHADQMSKLESNFLEASQKDLEESQTRERRIIQFRRVAVGAIALLVMGVLAAIALGQSQLSQQQRQAAWTAEALAANEAQARQTAEAESFMRATKEAEALAAATAEVQARQTAEARRVEAVEAQETAAYEGGRSQSIALAAQSQLETETGNPERGVLLALDALESYPYTSQAERALGMAVLKSRTRLIFRGHTGTLYDAAWSPDSTRIATAGWDGVRVWNAVTGEETLTLPGNCVGVAWSPDGRLLLTGAYYGYAVWDVTTGEQILAAGDSLSAPDSSLAWSPDGRRILTGYTYNRVVVWDGATGEPQLNLNGVAHAAWSPDSKQIIAVDQLGGIPMIFSAAMGDSLLALDREATRISRAGWSPDGSRVVVSARGGISRILEAITGRELFSLTGHKGFIYSAEWSPDGRYIVTASGDFTAKVWDPTTGQDLLTLAGHNGAVLVARWSPDGSRIVTAALDGTVRVWDVSWIDALVTLPEHEDWVWHVAWSPDGSRVATATGSWVAGNAQDTVAVWDAATGEQLFTLPDYRWAVWYVGWSPDGSRLLTAGDDSTARIWDGTTGKSLSTLTVEGTTVMSAAWSGDGEQFVTGSGDGTVRIWDATTEQVLLTAQMHQDSVESVTWSPDKTRIASAGSQTVKVWEAMTGNELLTFSGHVGTVNSVAWSKSGKYLVSAGNDGTAQVWDADTGDLLVRLEGHKAAVTSAEWSPNDRRILTASSDGTIRLWNALTGDELLVIAAHAERVDYAAWSPDGERIVTAGWDRTPRIWRAWQSTEALVAYARACCTLDESTDSEP